MIEKVSMKNWRSHLDSELNFSSGTNALVGIMGSGKTSILDAICFALFGTFPNLQSKKLKLDDIIMKKPSEKEDAEINLTFKSDSSIYTIRRVIEKGRGTSYSEIRQDGSLLEAPSSQRVTEIVERILKIDYDLFSKAIYSEQNGLDYFLTIQRGQRMRKIDELLVIDKFEKARSSIVSLINRISEIKSAKQILLDQEDEEQISNLFSALVEEIRRMNNEKEEFEKRINEVSEERSRLETDFYNVKKVMDDVELLEREKKGLESAIEEIRRNIESIDQMLKGSNRENVERENEGLKSEIERTEKELKYEEQRFHEDSSQLTELITKAQYKDEEIKQMQEEFEEKLELRKEFESIRDRVGENIEEQLKRRRKDLRDVNDSSSETNTRLKDLEEIIRHLSSPATNCPICDSILTDERKKLLIVQKEEMKQKAEGDLLNLNRKRQKFEEDVVILEEAQKKYFVIYEKIKDLDELKKNLEYSKRVLVEIREDVSKKEKLLEEKMKKVEKLDRELNQLNSKKNELEKMLIKIKDVEESTRRQAEVEEELKEIDLRIAERMREIEGKDVESFENLLKDAIAEEREIEVRISGFNQLMAEKSLRIEEYEKKISEIQRHKKEVAYFEKIIRNLKIFSTATEKTQIELRTEFVEAVNYSMNRLWNSVYPYQDLVGVRLNTEEGDYVLQLQERSGKWINVEGIASGGERSVAALALRIAFALVLAPQIRWLVLDEPTANLDSKAIEDLAMTLRDRIGEFVDQVFIITHDEKLENAVTGNLYKLERQKELDGVTKIVAM